jgi:hypothetical protein
MLEPYRIKVSHVMVWSFQPFIIKGRFTSGMVDALNAEISLGTVSNTRDAIQWLGYTYWFVRARQKQAPVGGSSLFTSLKACS